MGDSCLNMYPYPLLLRRCRCQYVRVPEGCDDSDRGIELREALPQRVPGVSHIIVIEDTTVECNGAGLRMRDR